MTLYLGENLIAGGLNEELTINNPFSLLDYKYSEYELSNASWLLSNGQYNSGATYSAVYNLLLAIYNGTTTKAGVSVKLSTETYADTDFVLNTGDTTFRLPLYTQRVLVKKYVSGTNWYNLYSDGWCEQGGVTTAVVNTNTTINLLKTCTDTNYELLISPMSTNADAHGMVTTTSKTTASAIIQCFDQTNGNRAISASWQACGYCNPPAISDYTEIKGLYFYVGDTVQDANLIAAAGVLTRIAELSDSYISGLGMPSSRYDSLTLGASGAWYTAPANGWFAIAKGGNNGEWVYIGDTTSQAAVFVVGTSAGYAQGLYPVKKGKQVQIGYTANGGVAFFNFIYAEGEN